MNNLNYIHLLSIVSHRVIAFYGPEDLVKLELSCPQRHLNDQIKILWANNTIQGLVYSKRPALWIHARNVYSTKVLVDHFLTEVDIIRFTELSSSVCEIEYRAAIFHKEQFLKLIKHCASISKFAACGRGYLSARDYVFVTEHCAGLTNVHSANGT